MLAAVAGGEMLGSGRRAECHQGDRGGCDPFCHGFPPLMLLRGGKPATQFPDFPGLAGNIPDIAGRSAKMAFMSLRGQFYLSVMLALLAALSLLAVVACWHARRSVENEMAMALRAADRVV